MPVDLGKQVGPLPLGAWVVVVGAGLGLAYYGYRSQNATPEVVEDVSGDAGVGTGAVGGWIPTTPPTQQPTAPDKPTTNEEWGILAINWLIAQGYDSIVSDSAIRKYLNGNEPKPSTQEWALQRIALAKFGPPPFPLPPGSNQPPATPPIVAPPPVGKPPVKPPAVKPPPVAPPPAKPKFRYALVTPWPTKQSTLWGIADVVYRNPRRWPDIYNANRAGKRRADGKMGMISNPNLIRPGWLLLIP